MILTCDRMKRSRLCAHDNLPVCYIIAVSRDFKPRRRERKRQKSAYLKRKNNNSFARIARAFLIFVHFFVVSLRKRHEMFKFKFSFFQLSRLISTLIPRQFEHILAADLVGIIGK